MADNDGKCAMAVVASTAGIGVTISKEKQEAINRLVNDGKLAEAQAIILKDIKTAFGDQKENTNGG